MLIDLGARLAAATAGQVQARRWFSWTWAWKNFDPEFTATAVVLKFMCDSLGLFLDEEPHVKKACCHALTVAIPVASV